MKKTLLAIIIALLMAVPAFAVGPPGSGSGSGVQTASDCDVAAYYAIGTLCQDTDDGKLYKGTGAAVVEIAAGASGDVVAADTAHTWGDGTGPQVWTFSVTGTDPTITVTAAAFTLNTSLALGANNLTMTGSLGATGAGKLTKIWAVDGEFTNYPTVNGGAVFNQAVTSTSNPVFSTLNLTGANSLALGTSRTNDGKIIISSGTALNDYLFTIVASNFASNLTWTLPTAAPGGANYLLNVDADGTMGYTDPASLGGGAMATDGLWDAKGDLAVGTGANTGAKLTIGSASTLLKVNTDTPGWTSTTITEAANSLVLANGTANMTLGAASVIDVAAGKTADINYNFTVNTGDVTLTGPFAMAAPGAANAVLTSDGTNWVRTASSANMISLLGSANYATALSNLGGAPSASPTFTTTMGMPAAMTNAAATTWTALDNNASAFSIGSTGKADIFKVITTDAGEGVTMSGTLGVTGVLTASGGVSGALNGTVGATTPAAGKFTTLEASTSLSVTAAATTGGYIRLLEGTNNGADYSSITGAADAGTYPSFTFGGSQGSEDLVLTATNDKWTFSSTSGATITITPALTVTGALTLSDQLNLMTTDADPATTAGGIKHDSSSTESQTTARGVLKWFDGTNVRTIADIGTDSTIITKTEFLPIRYAEDGAAAPAAAAAVTGKAVIARSFADGKDVVFFWSVPADYVGGGDVKYRVHYALASDASADDTVTFTMTGCAIANSADIACSAGTGLAISDELGTDDDQYQYMVTDYSAASNADWGIAAGGFAKLGFSYSDGDYDAAALVIGIEIKYKAKLVGFAGY